VQGLIRPTPYTYIHTYISKRKNSNIQNYNFAVVLYECETWSLTLREEHILRVFKNRVLGRILGPKMDEANEGWRKSHNEELHNLYPSPSIIRMFKSRRMKWEGRVAQMGEKRNAHRIWMGKPEGKRPL
jgi:hypothetical protein